MRWDSASGDSAYRTIDEARIIEILLLNGWVYEVRDGRRDLAEREARAALDRLVVLGLPYATSRDGGRLFDPVELARFLRWAGVSLGDPTSEKLDVTTGRRMAWEAYGGNGGDHRMPPSPAALAPARYRLTIKRQFNLDGRGTGERVRLRLPVPLPDGAVGEVRAGFLPDEGVETEIKTAPARVEILARVPECGRITVGVEAIFTTAAGAPAASDATLDAADRELYTRPSEGLIRVSDRIRSLAAELAGAETDSLAAARRFWTFMMEELACSPMHYDRLDPDHPLDHVLDSGWYDCLVGSALMAALCRARAIPARLVSGYMLHVTAPGFHTWLEVWIAGQGWLPFDLTCWSWSLGGRDAHWRDLYFGQLNQRVAVARPPRLFNSVGAVRLPSAWHLLSRIEGKGSVIEFRTIDTDALIYSDHMELEHLG